VSLDHVEVSSRPTVRRWRRFGHDRAYVKVAEKDIGYRDLRTGEVHCQQRKHLDAVAIATEEIWEQTQEEQRGAYRPRHAAPDEEPEADPAPEPVPVEAARPRRHVLPDCDLARNIPGQAARARARELLAAAPVQSAAARLVGAKTDERAYRIGADGEEQTAVALKKLGPGWRVLHAVPVGDRGSDIDHVVIGPGGVFTINAKHRPQARVWVRGDTFKVNDFAEPYVRNSRHEAARAARLLSAAAGFDVEVRGVIVVLGAQSCSIEQQPADGAVSVVRRKQLVAHLTGQPAVLGLPSVERVYDVARHLATWQPDFVDWQDFEAVG
jgi:hypothetical protein